MKEQGLIENLIFYYKKEDNEELYGQNDEKNLKKLGK